MAKRGIRPALLCLCWAAAAGHAQTFQYELRPPVTGGLPITKPVFVTHAGEPGKIYALRQDGILYAVTIAGNAAQTKTLLDLRSKVTTAMEGGLIGLAFHPDFRNNRKFYVTYTSGREYSPDYFNVLSEFMVKAEDRDAADPASERVLMRLSHPWPFHHLAAIAFGPDGYLYVGAGDGGSAVDANRRYLDIKTNVNAQDRSLLLGKFLRIDVDRPAPGKPYGIPPDNPYAGNTAGWKEEIWAYGNRYPWRWSFDRATGEIWSGNVGQSWYEEIQIIRKGKNYGWPRVEGDTCIFAAYCDSVFEKEAYAVDRRRRSFAIIGGYVYRGQAMPELVGAYLYADYSTGRVWALSRKDGAYEPRLLATEDGITSFGEDAFGNVYVTSFAGRGILLLTRPGANAVGPAPGPAAGDVRFRRVSASAVALELRRPAATRAVVYDMLGKAVATLAEGRLPEGRHLLAWDGRTYGGGRAEAGVYRLSISSGGTRHAAAVMPP